MLVISDSAGCRNLNDSLERRQQTDVTAAVNISDQQLVLGPVDRYVYESHLCQVQWPTDGGLGASIPPRNSEGPPKSCQTQPDL